MRNYTSRNCSICGCEYVPTGPAAKYCSPCAKEQHKHKQYAAIKEYRKRKGVAVGVGSGNNQGRGSEHHSYKTGIGIFRRYKKDACERCGSVEFLCVHHKDRNRANNTEHNLETVCKRCHQIEHECWKAFEGVTTSRKT